MHKLPFRCSVNCRESYATLYENIYNKSVPQITRSRNLHGTEAIITVKLRILDVIKTIFVCNSQFVEKAFCYIILTLNKPKGSEKFPFITMALENRLLRLLLKRLSTRVYPKPSQAQNS